MDVRERSRKLFELIQERERSWAKEREEFGIAFQNLMKKAGRGFVSEITPLWNEIEAVNRPTIAAFILEVKAEIGVAVSDTRKNYLRDCLETVTRNCFPHKALDEINEILAKMRVGLAGGELSSDEKGGDPGNPENAGPIDGRG